MAVGFTAAPACPTSATQNATLGTTARRACAGGLCSCLTFSAETRCDGQLDCGLRGQPLGPRLGSTCETDEWAHLEQGEHVYGLTSNNALVMIIGVGDWRRVE